MLREPRERTVSQYLHLKRYGEAYLRVSATMLAAIIDLLGKPHMPIGIRCRRENTQSGPRSCDTCASTQGRGCLLWLRC